MCSTYIVIHVSICERRIQLQYLPDKNPTQLNSNPPLHRIFTSNEIISGGCITEQSCQKDTGKWNFNFVDKISISLNDNVKFAACEKSLVK